LYCYPCASHRATAREDEDVDLGTGRESRESPDIYAYGTEDWSVVREGKRKRKQKRKREREKTETGTKV
jgi:hypothetical protein